MLELNPNKILDGIYSQQDSYILYNIVKQLNPQTVLEIGCRTGRTTSIILQAIRPDTKYWCFEKDPYFCKQVKSFARNEYSNYNVKFYFNVINHSLLKSLPPIDLLFIDAQHDYIFAKWYVENLFPLTHDKSVIHIHDIYYKDNLDSLGFKNHPQTHRDIVDQNKLKELYPTIYDQYYENKVLFEEDVIRNFCLDNPEYFWYSTTQTPICEPATKIYKSSDVKNCSFYLYKENYYDKIY